MAVICGGIGWWFPHLNGDWTAYLATAVGFYSLGDVMKIKGISDNKKIAILFALCCCVAFFTRGSFDLGSHLALHSKSTQDNLGSFGGIVGWIYGLGFVREWVQRLTAKAA